MLVREWIDKNYENIKFWVGNTMAGYELDNKEDFIHEVILQFMENKKTQDVIDKGHGRWFIVRIALNQFRSNSSHYAKTYRPPFNEFIMDYHDIYDDTYEDEKESRIQGVLNELDNMLKHEENKIRYYAMIMMLYFSNGFNFQQVSRILNISPSSVKTNYRKGLKILLDNYKKSNIFTQNISIKVIESEIMKYGVAQRNLQR